MKECLEVIKQKALPLIEEEGLILYKVYESNEFGVPSIRVILDSKESLSIDLDKVATLTEKILDCVNDDIPDNYYLEVSSRGIERELESDEEIKLAVGEYVCVKLYEKHEVLNEKEVFGTLLSFDGDNLKLQVMIKTRKKEIEITKGKIAKIRLAVKF